MEILFILVVTFGCSVTGVLLKRREVSSPSKVGIPATFTQSETGKDPSSGGTRDYTLGSNNSSSGDYTVSIDFSVLSFSTPGSV